MFRFEGVSAARGEPRVFVRSESAAIVDASKKLIMVFVRARARARARV